MDARDTPYGTEIRMIAYARHTDACRFVSQMTAHVWPFMRSLTWPAIVTTTIATTKEQLLAELQAPAALTLVSAHGPAKNIRSPRIGDGTPRNRIELRELARPSFAGFGARAGMIWDACYAGRPEFTKEFARLSPPGVVHVAPLGEIEYDDSVHIATTILHALLAPGGAPITPAAVDAAAERAAASADIKVWHDPVGGTEAS